jgi:hypothetical protein
MPSAIIATPSVLNVLASTRFMEVHSEGRVLLRKFHKKVKTHFKSSLTIMSWHARDHIRWQEIAAA